MSSITLKKIAQSLNLSISTVSRALKDHPDIAKETIKRVKEIAEALDYEPNANAIHLKKQDSRLFAVLVPNLSPFYASFISGIEEECRKDNYSLMILQNADDPQIEKINLKLCRQNRVTGAFVCMCTKSNDFADYDKLLDNDIPLLFFDKVPENNTYNKISIDDEKASIIAAEWILQKKSKNVLAIFGNEQLSITNRRLKAFRNKIDKSKIKINYQQASSTNEAELLCDKLINTQKFDSIFCMSDEILIGVMSAIQKAKTTNPVTAEVFCMSDGFFPNIYYPKIKYVETSGLKLAKGAYNIMTQMSKDKIKPQEYFIEPIVI